MAASVGKVRAVFTASTSGLTSGMAQAGASAKGLQSRLAGLQGSMRSLVAIQGAQLFGSIVSSAASGVRSLVGLGQSAAQTADDISKMSRRLGMSYGELASLSHAADLAGVSMETMAKGATKSDIAMVKAQNGNKAAQASFQALGLSVNDLAGMDAADRFAAISDAIGALPTAAQRAAAAVSIFGKSGAELLPLFEMGAGGVNAAAEAARRFGVELTQSQGIATGGNAAAAASFEALGLSMKDLSGMNAADRFTAISDAIGALPTAAERAAAAVSIFGQSGSKILPMFNSVATGVRAATADAERFGLALTNAQGVDIENMNDGFTRAGAAIQGVITQIVAYLAPALQAVTDTFSNLIGDMGGAKIGSMIGEKIIEGAIFFAGIADTFIAQSGGLFEYFSQIGGQWNAVWDLASRIGSVFLAVGNVLKAAFGSLILAISGPVQALASVAQQIGDSLGFDTSGLDAFIAGAGAFNAEIISGIQDGVNGAAANISDAFSDGAPRAGEAIATPLTDAIRNAQGIAQASAMTPNQPAAIAAPVTVEVKAELSREAIQGIDSRSTAGATEMFRLMRENPQQEVQNKIEENTRQTSANTRDMGIDIDSIEFAGAAGA